MKNLSEIDSLYASKISKLSEQTRLVYCTLLVENIQFHIVENSDCTEDGISEQLLEIIAAAKNESQKLSKISNLSICDFV